MATSEAVSTMTTFQKKTFYNMDHLFGEAAWLCTSGVCFKESSCEIE